MSDNPQAETTATPAPTETPAPVTATTAPASDVEEKVKAARAQAYREAQSKFDKDRAAMFKQAQQDAERRVQAVAQHATSRLREAGIDDPETIQRELEVEALRAKNAEYEQVQQQAEQWAQWQAWTERQVKRIADEYGIELDAAKYINAPDGETVLADALKDARKLEREKLAREAKEAKRAQIDAEVEGGAHTVLSGAPAGAVTDNPLSKYKLGDSRELYKLARENMNAQKGATRR
jgi:hypothetical protein